MQVIYDKVSGRSRGFGFVTMSSVEEVEEAVRKFNGYVSICIIYSLLTRIQVEYRKFRAFTRCYVVFVIES